MIIDCDTCVVRGRACGDCVITVLLRNPPIVAPPVELDGDEQRAVSALASRGLVPPLRLVRPTEPDRQQIA
jgi:hypothetical protein